MNKDWLRSRLWGLIILFLLVSIIVIPSPWAQRGEERISIDFHEADIHAVIKFISELTGKNFVVDSKVKGKVTVISPTKITIEEAYRMFESILEVEGYTTVPPRRRESRLSLRAEGISWAKTGSSHGSSTLSSSMDRVCSV